jgi:hypothetical protein
MAEDNQLKKIAEEIVEILKKNDLACNECSSVLLSIILSPLIRRYTKSKAIILFLKDCISFFDNIPEK